MREKCRLTKLILILALLLAAFVGFFQILTIILYNCFFNQRFDSYKPLMFLVSDFDGLNCEEVQFTTSKKKKLTGYIYSAGEAQRGVVVMAHGYGGGGHNSYMDAANFFSQNGYYVFAYDSLGTDKSEGKGTGGLPQGIIDLEQALSFVMQHPNLSKLPIFLFGHSWGGYCVSNVLNFFPSVKAVISVSGFNHSSDLIFYQGKSMVRSVIYLVMPFIKIYEYLKYGKYAKATAINGFKNSNAAIMVVHSLDDVVVPPKYGHDLYLKIFKENSRFTFLLFKDRGHEDILIDENDTYVEEFNSKFRQWLKKIEQGRSKKENKKRYAYERAEYITTYLDRNRWSTRIDKNLFTQFLDFYDENSK